MLLGLSVTAGFAHGALDLDLLLQRFRPFRSAMWLAGLYFVVVVATAWLLSDHIQIALLVLLAMSIWHFGEDYGRWNGVSAARGLLTRLVVGGAPVMAPVLLAEFAMSDLASAMNMADAGAAWLLFSKAWLALLAAWMGSVGVRHAHLMRHAWFELAGVLALNLLFSPLMAFALYFGAYHAPLHIWRVWRSRPVASDVQTFSRTGWAAIFVLTLALTAALWFFMNSQRVEPVGDWMPALRWLVLALTALTVPHLVLVSLCAPALSGHPPKPEDARATV
jgi:beta-carotene 15,15'-dioxygenase